ncbi:hypothetical protein [Magnetospirillum fulvum]|uniref:Uncharacterized protein n=1 Tax=Magnetospirillum fulvum TaxID=1082 RepID=A0A1H6HK86_MAGFU|nr:hypothetical protein [Magnetospirillum fulvum]SEH36141.1 hypothetical protein SAMN04244559_01903 [Magnetospirillum fulvum]
MSKSSASLPVKDISDDDLDLFFKVKLDRLTCPVCGEDSFEVLFSDSDKYLELRSGPGIREIGQTIRHHAYPALVFTCDNCAHTLLFSYEKVRDLIERIKSEVGDGRS